MNNFFRTNMVHLPMGEVKIDIGPKEFWTVLGSCIAVTLYDKRTKTGAMCHAQLSQRKREESGDLCSATCTNPCFAESKNDNRFVSCAINYMVKELKKRRLNINDLEVQVFGGSSILKISLGGKTVGERNHEFTKYFLKEHGIKPTKVDVGGGVGRKVTFDLETGIVKVEYQRQNETHAQMIAK